MYYSIGYHSYEDSGYIKLSNEKEFSQDEFEQMIVECAPFVVEKLKADFLREYDDKKYSWWYEHFDKIPHISFDSLYVVFADVLCEKFGFERIKYQAIYDTFGWANMMQENDWDSDVDENYHKIAAIIREGLQDAEMSPEYTKDPYGREDAIDE